MTRVLLLGGTAEATLIARALADARIGGMFSYAGRTTTPAAQPLQTRIGGFGGAKGLADTIRREGFSHVIDATHPFARQISRNSIAACAETQTPLVAFERVPWSAEPDDDWQHVSDVEAAVAALPVAPSRVFLAIGKQHLAPFAARPQHFYLLRLVDPPENPLPLRAAAIVIARGPFTAESDIALLRLHRITHVVAKNAGGEGARAKLSAARALGARVILIKRPPLPERHVVRSVAEVMLWLGQTARLGV